MLGGASSGTVKLWDLEEAKSEFVYALHFIYPPFVRWVVSGGFDNVVKVR